MNDEVKAIKADRTVPHSQLKDLFCSSKVTGVSHGRFIQ